MTTAWIVAYAILASFVLFLGVLELGTLRRLADVLERAESTLRSRQLPSGGLEPGSSAPLFTGELSAGGTITSEELSGNPYVVVFVSSHCRACEVLLRELRRGEGLDARVLVVVNDFADALDLGKVAGVTVVRQTQADIARSFQTSATPHAFVVNAHGRIAANGITNSLADLRRLLEEVLGDEGKAEVALLTSA